MKDERTVGSPEGADAGPTPDSPRAEKENGNGFSPAYPQAENPTGEKKAAAKKSAPAKKSGNAEFKRRYFDYYDDIKISDRQDW